MTSHKTLKKSSLSILWKMYKVAYGFLKPVLSVVVVLAAIFSLLPEAEGSNSRTVAFVIFVTVLGGLITMGLVQKRKTACDVEYKMYAPKILQTMQPDVMVPLLLTSLIILIPFYILIISSLKTHAEAASVTFTWWPQNGIDLQSYRDVFNMGEDWGISVAKSLMNSFVFAFVPTMVGVNVSSLVAYVFAKVPFKSRARMYNLLIMTMMMPGCVTMTTSYLLYDVIGWTNTPLPLIIPAFFGGAGTILFLREYYMGVPDGLLEAAEVEGAGFWQRYIFIMYPLGRPAIIAQLVMGFIGAYNDFLGPLIYLNNPAHYTIQILLKFLEGMAIDASSIATAGVASLVPMLLLYIIFQGKIIDGISMSSGLKG